MWFKRRSQSQAQSQAPDSELVRRCLQGDEDAWEAVVLSFAGRIFSMSYHFTGRKEEAEDLTQDIFIRIFQNLGTFRAESGSFSTWALKLSRNLIIDRYRQSRRFQHFAGTAELEVLQIQDDTRAGPQRTFEQAEASRVLGEAMDTLTSETKEAVILRDLHGMAYQEMAEVLGVPEGTVKSRINRGRLALARRMSRHPARHELACSTAAS